MRKNCTSACECHMPRAQWNCKLCAVGWPLDNSLMSTTCSCTDEIVVSHLLENTQYLFMTSQYVFLACTSYDLLVCVSFSKMEKNNPDDEMSIFSTFTPRFWSRVWFNCYRHSMISLILCVELFLFLTLQLEVLDASLRFIP